ncbi:MAG: hypothetical protein ABR607_11850 [Pyrinomonadaceae bacterium]
MGATINWYGTELGFSSYVFGGVSRDGVEIMFQPLNGRESPAFIDAGRRSMGRVPSHERLERIFKANKDKVEI